jgi:hypothetical protein
MIEASHQGRNDQVKRLPERNPAGMTKFEIQLSKSRPTKDLYNDRHYHCLS